MFVKNIHHSVIVLLMVINVITIALQNHNMDSQEFDFFIHSGYKDNNIFENKSNFVTNKPLNRIVINDYVYPEDFLIKFQNAKENERTDISMDIIIRSNFSEITYRDGKFTIVINYFKGYIKMCILEATCVTLSPQSKYIRFIKFWCCVKNLKVKELMDNMYPRNIIFLLSGHPEEQIIGHPNTTSEFIDFVKYSCTQPLSMIFFRDSQEAITPSPIQKNQILKPDPKNTENISEIDPNTGMVIFFGVALITIGVVVTVVKIVKHRKLYRITSPSL